MEHTTIELAYYLRMTRKTVVYIKVYIKHPIQAIWFHLQNGDCEASRHCGQEHIELDMHRVFSDIHIQLNK